MHHEVCHVLGGAFVLPHTTLHAAVLPYVLAFNAPASPGLGTANALDGLSDLYNRTGSRRPLRDLGLSREGIKAVIDSVLAAAPRPTRDRR
ncbi:alcohol dehydrogenase class IV [Streptomyces sp. SAI-144]|jgi:maleylacetate reductase|nr:alcohol dehydrogenase class IV [Streptomyces sp. SAI-144]